MTIRLQELRKQERGDLVLLVESLYGLCATRELLIEAEQEQQMLFNEDAVKVENTHDALCDRLDAIACHLGSTPPSGVPSIDRIEQTLANQRKLIDQLEPTCNRLAAFVAEELGRTPETFEDALTALTAELYRLRAPKQEAP